MSPSSSCSIDVVVPSALGTNRCSSTTSGAKPRVDGGASTHIGITAPARANSGIRSIGVAAVRKR